MYKILLNNNTTIQIYAEKIYVRNYSRLFDMKYLFKILTPTMPALSKT